MTLTKRKNRCYNKYGAFSRFSSILSYLSGTKIKVGFHRFSLEGLYKGNLHAHKVSYNPYMHISKNPLSFVNSLKVRIVQKYFGLFPPLALTWITSIAKKAGHEVIIVDMRTLKLTMEKIIRTRG